MKYVYNFTALYKITKLFKHRFCQIRSYHTRFLPKIIFIIVGDAGNNLTNLILNNLNHPDDEILLKNLESQDIFSQPVIFVPSLVNRASLKSVQSSNENNKKTALPSGEMLVTAIDSFSKDDTLIAKGNYDVSIPDNIKKLFILRKISDIFMKLLNDIEDGYIPTLSAVDQTKWGNCTFDEHK